MEPAVGCFAVLVVAESVLFDAAIDAQSDCAADDLEEDETADECPCGVNGGSEGLNAEHPPP